MSRLAQDGLFILIASALLAGCQSSSIKENPTTPPDEPRFAVGLETLAKGAKPKPKLPPDSVTLENPYFVTVYDPKRNIAYYTEYILTAQMASESNVDRKKGFKADPQLKAMKLTAPADSWYSNSGYQRGHLAPSEDFTMTREANDQTFILSNVVPQKKELNEKTFRKLEAEIRGWACTEEKLVVVTGPILEGKMKNLNGKPLPIPPRFFKAVLDLTPPMKAIGFIFTQSDNQSDAYKDRVVTIDEIESATGLDLFADQPTSDQVEIEATQSLDLWKKSKCE